MSRHVQAGTGGFIQAVKFTPKGKGLMPVGGGRAWDERKIGWGIKKRLGENYVDVRWVFEDHAKVEKWKGRGF